MNSKIIETKPFNVHAINRVRLELESLCGNSQFFDVELTKPEHASIPLVDATVEQFRKRITTLEEHQFEFSAKLTIMSGGGGSAVMKGTDFDGTVVIFEMAAKLFRGI